MATAIVLFVLSALWRLADRRIPVKRNVYNIFFFENCHRHIGPALASYLRDTGHLPTEVEGLSALRWSLPEGGNGSWQGPYLPDDSYLNDPIGGILQYRANQAGTEFTLHATGADGLGGTNDDISLEGQATFDGMLWMRCSEVSLPNPVAERSEYEHLLLRILDDKLLPSLQDFFRRRGHYPSSEHWLQDLSGDESDHDSETGSPRHFLAGINPKTYGLDPHGREFIYAQLADGLGFCIVAFGPDGRIHNGIDYILVCIRKGTELRDN